MDQGVVSSELLFIIIKLW